jgi:hypothetical protein
MSRPTSSPITAADAVLWTALDSGVRSLPQPVPAGLCELPLARMSRYEPKPDPTTGRLPDEEWVHVHRLRALTGQWYAVRVAGDAELGLPRAGDWPVLMAVLRLFEEAGWQGNTLADVSIRRLLATMGVTGGGKMVRRVRDALVRFAQVRVLVVPIAAAADPAEAFAELAAPADAAAETTDSAADGGAGVPALWSPGRVGAGRRVRRAERGETAGGAPGAAPGAGLSTGVLDVVWRDDTIERITVADAWRPRGGVTPTAWIDYARYFALTDPVAQRLYQLFAGAVARGEAAPLEQSLDWLPVGARPERALQAEPRARVPDRRVRELQARRSSARWCSSRPGAAPSGWWRCPGRCCRPRSCSPGSRSRCPATCGCSSRCCSGWACTAPRPSGCCAPTRADVRGAVLGAVRAAPRAESDPRSGAVHPQGGGRGVPLRQAGVPAVAAGGAAALARPGAGAGRSARPPPPRWPAATPAAPVACAVSPVGPRDEIACAAPVGFTLAGADADAGALWAAIAAELRRGWGRATCGCSG